MSEKKKPSRKRKRKSSKNQEHEKSENDKKNKEDASSAKLGSEYTQLEEQYIIRFPPELSKKAHKLLKNNSSLGNATLQFSGKKEGDESYHRTGTFTIDGKSYKASLLDLPSVIETQKTLDNRNYYKSGDIGQIIVIEEGDNSETLYDNQLRTICGLTPATKNIRKRKFRKRPEFSPQEIKDAEAQISRLQKGTVYTDRADIELIPVDDIEEMYEAPSGNQIIIMKNAPIIRAGYPSTFTEAELDLLPKHHRDKIKPEALPKEEEDEEDIINDMGLDDFSDLEDNKSNANDADAEDMSEDASESSQSTSTPTATPTSETPSSTSVQIKEGEATEVTEKKIRELRTQKVNIANEIATLQRKNEQNRVVVQDETNPRMKKRLIDKINSLSQTINQKKKEMSDVDNELAKLGTV